MDRGRAHYFLNTVLLGVYVKSSIHKDVVISGYSFPNADKIKVVRGVTEFSVTGHCWGRPLVLRLWDSLAQCAS